MWKGSKRWVLCLWRQVGEAAGLWGSLQHKRRGTLTHLKEGQGRHSPGAPEMEIQVPQVASVWVPVHWAPHQPAAALISRRLVMITWFLSWGLYLLHWEKTCWNKQHDFIHLREVLILMMESLLLQPRGTGTWDHTCMLTKRFNAPAKECFRFCGNILQVHISLSEKWKAEFRKTTGHYSYLRKETSRSQKDKRWSLQHTTNLLS